MQSTFVTPKLPAEPYHVAQIEGALTPGEQALLGTREIDLGIALSGGGVRSAFYSMGALKALHEKGVLQQADILSTVSGGGYLAYWLVTSQAATGKPLDGDFGSAALGEKQFPASLCHMVRNANFVTTWSMLKSVPFKASVRLYEEQIGDVFGYNDPGNLHFHNLRELVRSGYPHLIVNATLNRPRPFGWEDGLYEFTAAGTRGNGRGEFLWDDTESFPYRRAVAISGAAFAVFLKQKIAEPPHRPGARTVVLHDGGPSENLGAIALIRRAVPNIIVVDGEHDPDYQFGAYDNLKKRLPKWGGNIVIEGIERHLASGSKHSPHASYFPGEATGRRADGSRFTSKIHYLKMSMPAPLRETLAKAAADRGTEPETPNPLEPFWSYAHERQRDNDCKSAPALQSLKEFFSAAVHQYGAGWGSTWRASLPLGFFAMNFPQYTTADQSMYTNQAAAFIGLGYLQASAYPTGHP